MNKQLMQIADSYSQFLQSHNSFPTLEEGSALADGS